ncbi:MAG: PKD domain-containing protein, partial [Planctomycetes bacterium]|nr:PKD domain-containing protein [Planctomycetota bacterium]
MNKSEFAYLFDDLSGAAYFTTTIFAFVNDAPTADAGDDQLVNEGDSVQFSGVFTDLNDRNQDPISFHWDFGDGDSSTAQNPTHEYRDEGIYEATLTVSDDHGGSASDSMKVYVHNVAPTVDAGGPYTINEGGGNSFSLNGLFSDPGGSNDIPNIAWDMNGDGNFGEAYESFSLNDTVTWNDLLNLGLPSDGTALPIYLRVDDRDGGVTVAHTTLTINNLDPIAGTGGPYVINEGQDLLLDAGM